MTDAVTFLQGLKTEMDLAREGLRPIQAWVVDESAGRVRLRFAGETSGTAGLERYSRLAGPVLPVDTEVMCALVDERPFVLGPVQRGAPGSTSLALDDLTDVDLTGATTNQVLTRNASGIWVPTTPTAAAGTAFPTPWSALQSGQTWVSAHSSFPMRTPTSAAFALAASTAYGTFIVWPERAEYDSLAFRVTTAGASGAVARISVYRFDPVTLTVTLLDRTGSIAVDTVGWKNVDFNWGIQDPGIFVVFLIASAAVSINGIAANALASSPVPNLNYAPATAYVAGSAPPIPQGILRAQTFGDLPTPWVMSASHFVTTALPVGWLLATRRPL